MGRLHRGLQRCGEAIERKASTGVDQQGEERAGFEDDGEDDKDNDRTTEQRFEVAENNGTEIRGRGELRYTLSLQRVNNMESKFREKKNGQGEVIRYLYLLFLFLSPWSFVVSILVT